MPAVLVSRWGAPSRRVVRRDRWFWLVLLMSLLFSPAQSADGSPPAGQPIVPRTAEGLRGAASDPAADSARADSLSYLEGRVLDAATRQACPHANLVLFRLTSDTDTVGVQITGTFALAPNGYYQFKVAPGNYRLRTTHISYQAHETVGLDLVAGATRELDVLLSDAATFTLDRIEIRAKRVRHTEAAVIQQRRKAVAVSDAVSSEQIKKTADSNAAEALQRVSGLSLVDDKFVFVRGLGERYSSTLINGTPVTSPEPNKRVIPLDLIPAALIDNITIQKAYTPDMPEEFGGGSVNINTLDFPGQRIWSLKVASGYAEGTTGRTFLTYPGGSTDFLGMDDGTRALPKYVADMSADQPVRPAGLLGDGGFTPDQIADMGRSFNQTWAIKRETAKPAYNVGLSYGNVARPFGSTLGFVFGGVLDNKFGTTDSRNLSYGGSSSGDPKTDYASTSSNWKTTLGGVAGLSLRVDERTKLSIHSLLSRVTENEAREYVGPNEDHGIYLWSRRLMYVEQEIFSTTLGLEHAVPWLLGSSFAWNISSATATRHEPDRREYNYERPIPEEGEVSDRPWRVSGRTASMGFTRMFGTLDDEERSFEGVWHVPFAVWGNREGILTTGYFHSYRHRDSATRRFAFMNPSGNAIDLTLPPESLLVAENIGGTPRLFRLQELTRGTDAYQASLERTAGYFALDLPITRKLKIVAGGRVVEWTQEATTISAFSVTEQEPKTARLAATDLLPSANLTYRIGTDTNLRLAYSRTISRPDLRELSEFENSDYNSGYSYRGNSDLEQAYLRNYDFRVEHFLGLQELAAFSLFYKNFERPITMSLNQVGSQIGRAPINAESGLLYGAEFEIKAGFDRLWRRLRGLGTSLNYTIVHSELKTLATYAVHSTEQPLTGQSPHVVNAMLFFNPPGKRYSSSLVYNYYDERLYVIGTFGFADQYEAAGSLLDFTFSYRFGRITAKAAAKNLLESGKEIYRGKNLVEAVEADRSFSLSLSMGS